MKLFFSKIFQYIFEALFVTLIVFFFLEFYKTGIVTNYISFNAFLILTIFFGIVSILSSPNEQGSKRKKRFFIPLIASVLGGIIIYSLLPGTYLIYRAVPFVAAVAIFGIVKLVGEEYTGNQ